MLAAEQTKRFTYKAGTGSTSEPDVTSTEVLTDRLLDLDIGTSTPALSEKQPTVPEKTRTTSSSRPLTVDEDDLDLDLEIDDSIDTTVSLLQQHSCFLITLIVSLFLELYTRDSLVPFFQLLLGFNATIFTVHADI